jgi:hypothetical protein
MTVRGVTLNIGEGRLLSSERIPAAEKRDEYQVKNKQT